MRGFRRERILVIKLGAIGDFSLSIAAMQAIRRHHRDAAMALLTRPQCRPLARALRIFDSILDDTGPKLGEARALLAVRRQLLKGRFDRVYDLQRSDRSGGYFRLMWPHQPPWVGTVFGASHRYRPPRDRVLHINERERQQLALAGVRCAGLPDLSMIDCNVGGTTLGDAPFLLAPGSSARRREKRWPAPYYARLAEGLLVRGLTPVLTGGPEDQDVLREIADAVPAAVNLADRASILDLVGLARRACGGVGNDSGPMHIIALSGCPTLTLFSKASDPRKTRPLGADAHYLQRDSLSDLMPNEVLAAIRTRPRGRQPAAIRSLVA